MTTPRIRTDRLLLREWRTGDRTPFAAMNADSDVMEYFPSVLSRADSDAQIERFRQRWRDDGHGPWAVERIADSSFLGFAGLASPHFDAHFTPAVEVGWRLVRHAWGHGYATEAARAALEFGFMRLGLVEIVSFTVPRNLRSRRVMERIGMHRDAADDFDHPRLAPDSALRRHVLYRLQRVEWERGRPSPTPGPAGPA